jgi:hypothetical protein
LKSSNALNNPPELKPSRWARASREDLEALAEAAASPSVDPNPFYIALARLRDSCPPLRTEAEVAAEAMAILRSYAGLAYPNATLGDSAVADRLRALAKEPTR